ncbi:MAG: SLBB domain-containing protein [Bacteroidota bacterium]
MKVFIRFCVLGVLLLSSVIATAQIPVNIDNLTDEQFTQLVARLQLSGLTESELELKAKDYGLTSEQVVAFKKRMDLLGPASATQAASGTSTGKADTYTKRDAIKTPTPVRRIRKPGELDVYGADNFDNAMLSFEPNLTIATPANYVIGVNDQLIIDVYGISDVTRKLKVTTEGDIRLPNLGPIKVAGLTIEAARAKIKTALTKIYPGIANGTVSVQVSIGQIRSIQVTLIGETRQPGTYTISSLATLMNALYASGGPNDIGSYRDIELVRNGNTVVVFDLYDFLLRADLSKNVLLQDGDVIRIKPYQKRVALKGAVKKQAIFDVKDNEFAGDILRYAGGFADQAYKDMVRITRFGAANKEVISVKGNQLAQLKLVSGDTLTVDTLANIYVDRVSITGSVYYPGTYGIGQVPSLKELLTFAKPKEDAYFERGMLRRLKADYTPEIINFNVRDAINGQLNITLQREDSVHVYRLSELREKYTLVVNGEVNTPGTYAFFENMTVQDLVLMAGGYTDGAALQKIEVSRRLRTRISDRDTAVYSLIKEINLEAGAVNPADLNFPLSPFDVVSIRRSPAYKEQISVVVEGEVLYPGKYTLSGNKERLSDMVKRAGGLKLNAFATGAVLFRKTYVGRSQADVSLVNAKANLINTQSGKAPATTNTGDSTLFNQLSEQLKPVGLKLDLALQNPGSQYDLFLEEGDVLKVPKSIQTIQTFGMVNVPTQISYREGLSFRQAINESGGFGVNASRKNSYVVYANGEVRNTRNFLFFRKYPAIKPGAELYVPAKREGKKLSTGEVVGIVSGLTSLLGLIVVLINTSK